MLGIAQKVDMVLRILTLRQSSRRSSTRRWWRLDWSGHWHALEEAVLARPTGHRGSAV